MSYIQDWDYDRYLLLGGYGSGKSKHTAIKIVLKLLNEKRKCLVLRNVYETLKESCFSLFHEVLEEMDILSDTKNVMKAFQQNKVIELVSPLRYKFPNGSEIIFKGCDNFERLKSINGVSIVWIEECSEITYAAYREILGRIRTANGRVHIILTCNPVGKENWVYTTFFARTDKTGNKVVIQDEYELYQKGTLVNTRINTKNGGVYYHHSLPDDNPFLKQSYINVLDEVKETDPQLWLVSRWGRFGVNGERVLPRFTVAKDARGFVERVRSIPSRLHFFGLDFGFETSYNAYIACCVDETDNTLLIYDEVYVNKVTDDVFIKMDGVQRIRQRTVDCEKPTCADSSEPKTIQYFRNNGFPMYGCKKYPGSRLQNTKKVRTFQHIICSPMCPNTIRELSTLTFRKDQKTGMVYMDEFNIDPHTFSAIWYALDTYTVMDIKQEVKQHVRRRYVSGGAKYGRVV